MNAYCAICGCRLRWNGECRLCWLETRPASPMTPVPGKHHSPPIDASGMLPVGCLISVSEAAAVAAEVHLIDAMQAWLYAADHWRPFMQANLDLRVPVAFQRGDSTNHASTLDGNMPGV